MDPSPPKLLINCLADLDLALAAKVATGRYGVELGNGLLECIRSGRMRYERFIQRQSGYVYGSTTAPGNRAKQLLTTEDSARQGSSLDTFITRKPGFIDRMLPPRTVRLALLARLTNVVTGRGKLTVQTAEAICRMIGENVPEVPLDGQAGPGEVMAMSWLLAPIGHMRLDIGEAMALVNGSPFATAMVTDAALTSQRQLEMALDIFALSAEAALMPRGHFDSRLADCWPDPLYKHALEALDSRLEGGASTRLSHQAPVAWRVTPNVVAAGLRSSEEAARTAELSLKALKDNPTFLFANDEASDETVSSGGYHDQRASRALDSLNAAWSDLAVLAYRQVAKLVGGVDLGLPHLLSRTVRDGVGTEYIVWTLTSSIARAQQAACPAGLALSLEDPGGNQSDIAQPAFIAYARHLEAAAALNECLAALYTAARLALEVRESTVPVPLRQLWETVPWQLKPEEPTSVAAGEVMRRVARHFNERTFG
jgi:histidine ammonia-lyase